MKIGFIGVGNMNSAIIDGLVANGYNQENIYITNRTFSKMDKYLKTKINRVQTSEEVIDNSDVIILGIKPNDYKLWLDENQLGEKTLISIGAGITSEFLANYTHNFILTMPNTPSSVGHGTTLIIESPNLTEEIINIFNAFGKAVIINETELPEYMLLTGCSPAYFFTFVDQLSKQFELLGITGDQSSKLLIDVMEGSLEMLKGELSANQLTQNVCSPGGVTIEVVKQLNLGLEESLNRGFKNALARNEELKG